MRSNRTLPLLIVAVLVALGAARIFWNTGPGELAAPPRSAGVPKELDEERPTPAPAAAATEQRRQAPERGTETPAEPERETEAGEPAEPNGALLRVRVVAQDSGRQLEGLRLIVTPQTPAGERFELLTDVDGRAASERSLRPGILELDHAAQLDDERYAQPWEVLESSVLFDAAPTDELLVHARPPQLEVLVEARRPDGSPLADAGVLLTEGRPGGGGSLHWSYWRESNTDANGVARFLLYGDDWREYVFASSLGAPVDGLVSDTLYIDPPITPGPWRLQLYAGNALTARVLGPDEQPVEGVRVSADLHHRVRTRYTHLVPTDARGEARFESLPNGTYSISAYHPKYIERMASTEIEIGALADNEIVLRLEDETEGRLVVAGRVLEPDGSPAAEGMLLVSCDARPPERIFVEEEGAFEFRSNEPCAEVVVYAAASIYADPIEPERVRVPAGTTGVEFRRTVKTEQVMVLFQLVDATTQEPIGDALDAAIILYREPPEGTPVTARSFFGPDNGTSYVDFHPHPDLRWLVSVPGYQEQRGDLPAPAAGDEPPIYRIELARGFEREVVVRDAASGRRLGGVRVADGAQRVIGVSSSDGSVLLSSGEWLEALQLSLDGYETLEWDPSMHWNTFAPNVWMRPSP